MGRAPDRGNHPLLPFPENGPSQKREDVAPCSLLAGLPYSVDEIAPDNILRTALSQENRRTQIAICFPELYAKGAFRPIEELTQSVESEIQRTSRQLKGKRGSLFAEKEQLIHIGRLIEELGTNAATDFIAKRARGDLEKGYQQRLYGAPAQGGGEFGKRSLLPLLSRWIAPEGAQESVPLHPKEALLLYFLERSSHLEHGGRVVVFCNHEGTKEHLLALLRKEPRVAHATTLHELASSQTGRSELASSGHATSHPDKKIEVVIGTSKEFTEAKLLGLETMEGALFLVYQLHSLKFGRNKDLIPRSIPPMGVPETLAYTGPVAPLPSRSALPTIRVRQSILFDSSRTERDIRACFSIQSRT